MSAPRAVPPDPAAAPEGAGRGFFAGGCDFDGSATDDLVRTIGLLIGASPTEAQLARLARELATHVDRRDARVVLDQLAWRLGVVRTLHERAAPPPDRAPPRSPR